jgi:hypothetical protein
MLQCSSHDNTPVDGTLTCWKKDKWKAIYNTFSCPPTQVQLCQACSSNELQSSYAAMLLYQLLCLGVCLSTTPLPGSRWHWEGAPTTWAGAARVGVRWADAQELPSAGSWGLGIVCWGHLPCRTRRGTLLNWSVWKLYSAKAQRRGMGGRLSCRELSSAASIDDSTVLPMGVREAGCG